MDHLERNGIFRTLQVKRQVYFQNSSPIPQVRKDQKGTETGGVWELAEQVSGAHSPRSVWKMHISKG